MYWGTASTSGTVPTPSGTGARVSTSSMARRVIARERAMNRVVPTWPWVIDPMTPGSADEPSLSTSSVVSSGVR